MESLLRGMIAFKKTLGYIGAIKKSQLLLDSISLTSIVADHLVQEDLVKQVTTRSRSGSSSSSSYHERRRSYSNVSYFKPERSSTLDNMNYHHWLGLIKFIMPKVLSVVLRTSPITVDVLSASSLKAIIEQNGQYKKDKASNRNRNTRRAVTFGVILPDFARQLYTSLVDMRTWMTSDRFLIPGSDRRLEMTLIGLDVSLLKTPRPLSNVDISIGGIITFKLPIDDDTCCQLLSTLLAKVLPVYSLDT